MKLQKSYRILTVSLLTWALIIVSGRCTKSADSKEIFRDEFNRSNSSTLGGSWTINQPSGTFFTLNSNMAKPLGSTATTESGLPSALYTGKVSGAFKVSAKFVISGADYDSMGYLIGRSAASDVAIDSYLCGYYYLIGSTAPKKYYFALKKMTSGVATTIGEVAMHTLTSGKTDTITFTFDGTSLTCAIAGNSTISISVTDSSYGDGYTGMTGGGNSTPYLFFDDFLVEKL